MIEHVVVTIGQPNLFFPRRNFSSKLNETINSQLRRKRFSDHDYQVLDSSELTNTSQTWPAGDPSTHLHNNEQLSSSLETTAVTAHLRPDVLYPQTTNPPSWRARGPKERWYRSF